MESCIVTTEDLKQDYTILGPVHFCINKESFKDDLEELVAKYEKEILELIRKGSIIRSLLDWTTLYWKWVQDKSDLDKAFFIGVEELKNRARLVHGNAVIGMRHSIEYSKDGTLTFHMYGTAVKLKENCD